MSQNDELIKLINNYNPTNSVDLNSKKLTLEFLKENTNIGKNNIKGHITGSGFVINPKRDKLLLNYHQKLNKWIQFGGHLESNEDVINTAKRETKEETGINEILILSEQIYDIDVHEIPDYKDIQKHIHYDIRFLIQIDDKINPILSSESKEIKWINLEDVEKYSKSESILRMVKKINNYKPIR